MYFPAEAGKAAGVGLTKEPTDSVKKGLDQVITAASAATVTKPKGVKGVIQRAVEYVFGRQDARRFNLARSNSIIS